MTLGQIEAILEDEYAGPEPNYEQIARELLGYVRKCEDLREKQVREALDRFRNFLLFRAKVYEGTNDSATALELRWLAQQGRGPQ